MPGFKSGKELLRFLLELKDNNDNGLIQFTSDFFRVLKEANPHREENDTTEDKKALDTLARLLVGDEICSACCVSFSGDRIVLATNKHIHIDDYIKHEKRIKIHESHDKNLRYEFEFIDIMEFGGSDRETLRVSKSSGKIICARRDQKDNFELIAGDLNIIFTQNEHKFPFPNQQEVTLSLNVQYKSLCEMYEVIKKIQPGNETNWLRPVTNYLNPLRRRAAKLLRNLSLIANSILSDPSSELQVAVIMEMNKQWPQFLNDSLTYELSLQKPYSSHINTASYGDVGTRKMLEFYEWLIEYYQQYKNRMRVTTSAASVDAWLTNINQWIMNPDTPAPDFIKSNPEQFIKLLRRYLIDLVSVEDFVRKDARKNGRFSNIIKQANLFKDEIPVVVIDGVPEVHAEMRLLEEHLTRYPNLTNYYGITMLCCALCTYTLKRFGVAEYRGSHSILYDNWIFIDIVKDKYLDRFLGNLLSQRLTALTTNRCFPPGVARVKGNEVKQSELALMIIPAVKKINNREAFSKLGISEEFLLTGSSDGIEMYPDDESKMLLLPAARSDSEAIKIVIKSNIEELVLLDRRRIIIRGVLTAADDGNCGFRSILGEAYLKESNALFTRKGVIEFLKTRLSSMTIRMLVAKDILAKYNEWVSGQWIMDQDRLFPIEIKTRFIAYRQRAAQNNDAGYQNNLLREIEEFCREDNTLLSYLNNYLINDSIWPHLQGSLLAFATMLGIRLHCFQKQLNGAYQVLADDGQDPGAEFREEVFILQSEARNHFDRLVVEILPPSSQAAPVDRAANYDPRFLPSPQPGAAAASSSAPASQPAFTPQQIAEIEAHAAILLAAKK